MTPEPLVFCVSRVVSVGIDIRPESWRCLSTTCCLPRIPTLLCWQKMSRLHWTFIGRSGAVTGATICSRIPPNVRLWVLWDPQARDPPCIASFTMQGWHGTRIGSWLHPKWLCFRGWTLVQTVQGQQPHHWQFTERHARGLQWLVKWATRWTYAWSEACCLLAVGCGLCTLH